jgi:hypothetical protein
MDAGFSRVVCPISLTRRIKEIWPTFDEGAKVAVHFRLAAFTGRR